MLFLEWSPWSVLTALDSGHMMLCDRQCDGAGEWCQNCVSWEKAHRVSLPLAFILALRSALWSGKATSSRKAASLVSNVSSSGSRR